MNRCDSWPRDIELRRTGVVPRPHLDYPPSPDEDLVMMLIGICYKELETRNRLSTGLSLQESMCKERCTNVLGTWSQEGSQRVL